MMLGAISRKYESRTLGPGAISNNPDDPGGKSYGCYQISLAAGTLKNYIDQSIFKKSFEHLILGSEQFDSMWVILAEEYPKIFFDDQHKFIVKTHFMPTLQAAKKLKFKINELGIQEALFSISVQHRNYMAILVPAMGKADVVDQIKALYESRVKYISRLVQLSDSLKESLIKRYTLELDDVLSVQESSLFSV